RTPPARGAAAPRARSRPRAPPGNLPESCVACPQMERAPRGALCLADCLSSELVAAALDATLGGVHPGQELVLVVGVEHGDGLAELLEVEARRRVAVGVLHHQ